MIQVIVKNSKTGSQYICKSASNDDETANYIRKKLELYLKTWVLPNLTDYLNN